MMSPGVVPLLPNDATVDVVGRQGGPTADISKSKQFKKTYSLLHHRPNAGYMATKENAWLVGRRQCLSVWHGSTG